MHKGPICAYCTQYGTALGIEEGMYVIERMLQFLCQYSRALGSEIISNYKWGNLRLSE